MSEILIDTAKMTERGQVVIPKDVRKRMGLTQGSRLIVIATDDSIVFQKIETVGGKLKAREIIAKARLIVNKFGFKK